MIPALTGLRGVAALWVVLYHMAFASSLDVPVLDRGYLGVDVFFILSGFILSYVHAARSHRDYPRFLRARMARIFPLNMAVLGVLGLIVLLVPGFASRYPLADQRFGPDSFLASLLLVQNWAYWLPTCWNTPSWSLSAEWMAYLLFPGFMAATQWGRGALAPMACATAALAGLVAVLLAKGAPTPDVEGMPGMLRMGFEFACGCFLFRATANGLRPLPRAAELAVLGLLLLAMARRELVFLALFGLAGVVLLAAQNRGWVARALSARPMVFLGEISFSIYMVHWLVLQLSSWALAAAAPGPAAAALWQLATLAAILGLSVLTYRFLEVPSRAWGRSLGGPPPRVLAQADGG